MDFNVITSRDITQREPVPEGVAGSAAPSRPGATSVDDYWTKIRKYVPAETIGAYLLIDNLIVQIYDDRITAQRWWLSGAAIVFGGLTWFATRTLFNIERVAQRLVAVLAFAVWVVAGGTLLSTYSWWESGFGVMAVVFFGAVAAVFKLRPLKHE